MSANPTNTAAASVNVSQRVRVCGHGAKKTVESCYSVGDLQFMVVSVTGMAVGNESRGNAKMYQAMATLRFHDVSMQ